MSPPPQPPLSKPNLFRPTPPTTWDRLQQNPPLFIAHWLYTHQTPVSPPIPSSPAIKLVCISDTHNTQPRVPNGDILIHAGDLTINGTFAELQAQLNWLNTLPHSHKIVVAGNHDLLLDQIYYTRYPNRTLASASTSQAQLGQLRWGGINYLENRSITLDIRGRTLRIYGAPQTPQYGNWAFQYPPMTDVWKEMIPLKTDVLVTHGPAKGHVDAESLGAGCSHMLREVRRVKPRVHICGHIHQARGTEVVNWDGVQWGYDSVSMGEGGVLTLLMMLGAWILEWVGYMLGRKRKGRTTFVNAAVEGRTGLIEGDDTIVVEI